MSIEAFLKRTNTRDQCVYWAPSESLTGDGVIQYENPVEINCTWKDDVRMIRDFWEKEVASRAHVYSDIDLDEKGVLYHGRLTDLTQAQKDDPMELKNAFEILRFMKTPSLGIKNRHDRKSFL